MRHPLHEHRPAAGRFRAATALHGRSGTPRRRRGADEIATDPEARFWATGVEHLNDHQELVHGLKFVRGTLTEFIAGFPAETYRPDEPQTHPRAGRDDPRHVAIGRRDAETRSRRPSDARQTWPELRRRSGANSYLAGLVSAVETDPVLPPLVDCLDTYGLQGRFYFLDQLGDRPQRRNTPQRYWISIECAAIEASAHLRQFRAEASADRSNKIAHAAFRSAVRDHIARSIENAWETVAACGKLHRLGPTGDVFGREVHRTKVGRQ